MTPESSLPDPRPSARQAEAPQAQARTGRRRAALLRMVRRDGRMNVRPAPGDTETAERLDLLDALNTAGLVRWGGVSLRGGTMEFSYLKA